MSYADRYKFERPAVQAPVRGQFRDDEDRVYLSTLKNRTPAQEKRLAALLSVSKNTESVIRKTQSKKGVPLITPVNAPLMYKIVKFLQINQPATKKYMAAEIGRSVDNVNVALNKMGRNGFVSRFYAEPMLGSKKKIVFWTLTEKGNAID